VQVKIKRFNESVKSRLETFVKDVFQDIEDEYLDYEVIYKYQTSLTSIRIERKLNRLEIERNIMRNIEDVGKYADSLNGVVSIVEAIKGNIGTLMSHGEFREFIISHEYYNNFTITLYHNVDKISIDDIFDMRGPKVDIREYVLRKFFIQEYGVEPIDVILKEDYDKQGIYALLIRTNNISKENMLMMKENFSEVQYDSSPVTKLDVFDEILTDHYHGGTQLTTFWCTQDVLLKMV